MPPINIDPAAAFPDRRHRPGDAELATTVGASFAPVGQVINRLHSTHPEVTSAWQYSEKAGWYQVHLLKKRRLLYVVPKRGDFRLSIILGGKALTALQAGPYARRVKELLKTSRHYPEGTAFSFEHELKDPDLLTAFLEVKISPQSCAA